ncbi:MAG: hypothetical protein O3C63_03575 [Cyanobacteria bacterium]|nr:hypothetical protein [Cyanobacteriota bacterium]
MHFNLTLIRLILTDFSNVTQADLNIITENIRTAPLKCLDWMTPAEALEKELAFDTS